MHQVFIKNAQERAFAGDHFGLGPIKIDRIIPELRMRKIYHWRNAIQTYGDNFFTDFPIVARNALWSSGHPYVCIVQALVITNYKHTRNYEYHYKFQRSTKINLFIIIIRPF